MEYVDWAWQYVTANPWIIVGTVVCSWAAHVATQYVKALAKAYRRRLGATKLKAISFLFASLLGGWAYSQAMTLEQAVLGGLLLGFCHATLVTLLFRVAEARLPTVHAALEGELYVDDPTVMQTVVGAVAGTKIKRSRRSAVIDPPADQERRGA